MSNVLNTPASTTRTVVPEINAAILGPIIANATVPAAPATASAATQPKPDLKLDALQVFSNYLGQLTTLPEPQQTKSVKILEDLIEDIDEWLALQVTNIMRTKEFKDLEASWRGLRYLVFNSETGESLKLRLFCVKRDTLEKDLSQAIDKDQSNLFRKIYEEEYGTYGGNPFSLLVGDFFFDKSAGDMEFLRNLSGVAAAAHTPFIAAASPDLFGLTTFADLGRPRDLSKIFESTDLAEWRSFRESEDSRYVTLCLPRFLLRLPYGPKFIKSDKFPMDENPPLPPANGNGRDESWKDIVPGMNDNNYLWGNAAYALGVRITSAFARYGWCAAIRGHEGGGIVPNLPVHVFNTAEGDKALKCPTEVAITDRREFELDKLGFVALVHRKGENYATFFGGASTQKPKKFDLDAANANAALSARLPYLLAASRFAHYLKVICRDKVGSFQTKETLGLYLNRWISQYVLAMDDAGQDLKAKYPLREARIDVADVPGKPGAYSAVCFLRPHFQLEELTTSIRLVAELPPPVAA